MAHPQNSPRGLFAKTQVNIAAGGGVEFEDYSTSAVLLSGNSTGLLVAAGVMFSGQTGAAITQDSTGILIGARYISTNTTGNSTT